MPISHPLRRNGWRALGPVIRLHPFYPSVAGHPPIAIIEDTQESRDVLAQIYALIDKPDYQVRAKWRPGTVVMWDNFSTQHYAVGDHYPAHRQMNRITVAQDRRAPFVPPAGG